MRILITNQKGGVGKSTISANLAHYFASTLNKRTTLVDFDTQASSSKWVRSIKPQRITVFKGTLPLSEGANRIFACASHAVFSPPSYERLSVKDLFEQVIVTNSIPVLVKDDFQQLKVLSVANMLGEAIWRIHEESSVSSMFR
mgnify:CR=1 FL=1